MFVLGPLSLLDPAAGTTELLASPSPPPWSPSSCPLSSPSVPKPPYSSYPSPISARSVIFALISSARLTSCGIVGAPVRTLVLYKFENFRRRDSTVDPYLETVRKARVEGSPIHPSQSANNCSNISRRQSISRWLNPAPLPPAAAFPPSTPRQVPLRRALALVLPPFLALTRCAARAIARELCTRSAAAGIRPRVRCSGVSEGRESRARTNSPAFRPRRQ